MAAAANPPFKDRSTRTTFRRKTANSSEFNDALQILKNVLQRGHSVRSDFTKNLNVQYVFQKKDLLQYLTADTECVMIA